MIRKFAKYWRDSASLLVVARDRPTVHRETYNYKVLVFKRTAKTSFMPNSVVFPGGGFDKQDSSLDWEAFFHDRSVSSGALKKLTEVDGSRPPIFHTERTGLLDRNLSLRLCALREAFEELGVLLVMDEQKQKRASYYSNYLPSFDVSRWQQRIHDGETSFQELHTTLGTVPDLFNLYEWSCWLTPAMFRKRRFETAFYLAVLNEVPNIHPEPHEVQEYYWDTPASLLEAHREEKIWLAPPQTYELTRLSYIYDIDQLARFAALRNRKGSTLLCPVQYNAADGVIFVLPGDDLYPAGYDYISDNPDLNMYGELPQEVIRKQSKKLHRVEHKDLHHQAFFLNHQPLDGHLHIQGQNDFANN